MTFDPHAIAKYTARDVGPWVWDDPEDGTFVGYIADEEEGAPLGLAFVRFRKGVSFEFTWPYDEVSIVTRGSLTVRTEGGRVTARQGEILNQPRGVPATFDIEEDLEMICVHHPTFATAFGVSLRDYMASTEAGKEGPQPKVAPRGPQAAGGFFDPTAMQRFALADVPTWTTADEPQGAWVGYIADKAEGSPFGLAFSDFRKGGVFEFEFPYDEVAAVTQGGFTVRSQGRTFSVHAGEMLYMPQGVSARFEIDEDTIAVGVHHPTFEDAFGHPPHGTR